ncbi:hypothetical protein [Brevibacillus fulvus]|uniref:ABC transporter periplasmic binding protein yphF n=1 Tax=Brevibacillus fulvus TaxID=1125967 RepID=A0A938Y050_9BACL|nr:hypothetical protein [Brevibacillus fulvus]MBM7588700.1 hypothetical protein [Brevibacillus fulvus]
MIGQKRSVFLYLGMLACLSLLFSGCMYPKERRAENQVPSSFYLEATQKAVEQYQTETGVLPIVTKPLDTPIFEKYELDFSRLMPKYLPDAPANSFERGGVYKYVLIDPETKPTVRLINLSVVSKVADVQQAVDRYLANRGKLPIGEDIGNGYFRIDFDAIGMDEVQVPSMASNQLLPLIVNAKGEVGIDYAADIAVILRNSKAEVPPNTDPRYVAARESMFVPAKSFPYEMVKDEPRLLKLP